MCPELCRAVADKGYRYPTPIQLQSIPAILEGRDVYGSAHTGTGKTASFALPLLQINAGGARAGKRETRALILVPTRELAAQVSASVRAYGAYLRLKSATIAGGTPFRRQIKEVKRGVDIIIATPGRLLDLLNRDRISLQNLSTLVLDEADRMLDMGFVHDIHKILARAPRERQTLLFSATSTDEIEKLVQAVLNNPLRIQIGERNQTPDEVSHIVYFVAHEDKPKALAKLCKTQAWGQVLIFTRTRAGADALKDKLMECKLSSRVIHSGKPQSLRTQTLKRFKAGKFKILIATDIAARGLDIHSLPHVVNYELPRTSDDYINRIGRTGRAGHKGSAISLVAKLERQRLARIERQIKNPFQREKLEGFEEAGAPEPERDDRKPKPFTKPWKRKPRDPAEPGYPKTEFSGKKKERPDKKKKSDAPRPARQKKKTGFEIFFSRKERRKRE
ncbi:MAG: DEAD/DEAH box helicase [Elusimicrobiota bacterium]